MHRRWERRLFGELEATAPPSRDRSLRLRGEQQHLDSSKIEGIEKIINSKGVRSGASPVGAAWPRPRTAQVALPGGNLVMLAMVIIMTLFRIMTMALYAGNHYLDDPIFKIMTWWPLRRRKQLKVVQWVLRVLWSRANQLFCLHQSWVETRLTIMLTMIMPTVLVTMTKDSRLWKRSGGQWWCENRGGDSSMIRDNRIMCLFSWNPLMFDVKAAWKVPREDWSRYLTTHQPSLQISIYHHEHHNHHQDHNPQVSGQDVSLISGQAWQTLRSSIAPPAPAVFLRWVLHCCFWW